MEHELFRMQRTGVSDAWMELDGMGDILSDGWMQCLFRPIADPELWSNSVLHSTPICSMQYRILKKYMEHTWSKSVHKWLQSSESQK